MFFCGAVTRDIEDHDVGWFKRLQENKEAQGIEAYKVSHEQIYEVLNMLGAVYQFERDIMKQRQAEGIAAAKLKGVYNGRTTSYAIKIGNY